MRRVPGVQSFRWSPGPVESGRGFFRLGSRANDGTAASAPGGKLGNGILAHEVIEKESPRPYGRGLKGTLASRTGGRG
jgi:hypothetical protein